MQNQEVREASNPYELPSMNYELNVWASTQPSEYACCPGYCT